MKRTKIKAVKKVCVVCGEAAYIFSKGRCKNCSQKSYGAMARKRNNLKRKKRRAIRAKRDPNGIQAWKERLDRIFSKFIRLRDCNDNGYCRCFTCDVVGYWEGDTIQNGHFRSRRYNNTRYDELNCNAQCEGCNVYRQGEQYIYGVKLDERFGETTADSLLKKSGQTRGFTREELSDLVEYYGKKVKTLLKQKML